MKEAENVVPASSSRRINTVNNDRLRSPCHESVSSQTLLSDAFATDTMSNLHTPIRSKQYLVLVVGVKPIQKETGDCEMQLAVRYVLAVGLERVSVATGTVSCLRGLSWPILLGQF